MRTGGKRRGVDWVSFEFLIPPYLSRIYRGGHVLRVGWHVTVPEGEPLSFYQIAPLGLISVFWVRYF